MSDSVAWCILAGFKITSVFSRIIYHTIESVCEFAVSVLQGYIYGGNKSVHFNVAKKINQRKRKSSIKLIEDESRNAGELKSKNFSCKTNESVMSKNMSKSTDMTKDMLTISGQRFCFRGTDKIIECNLHDARKVTVSFDFYPSENQSMIEVSGSPSRGAQDSQKKMVENDNSPEQPKISYDRSCDKRQNSTIYKKQKATTGNQRHTYIANGPKHSGKNQTRSHIKEKQIQETFSEKQSDIKKDILNPSKHYQTPSAPAPISLSESNIDKSVPESIADKNKKTPIDSTTDENNKYELESRTNSNPMPTSPFNKQNLVPESTADKYLMPAISMAKKPRQTDPANKTETFSKAPTADTFTKIDEKHVLAPVAAKVELSTAPEAAKVELSTAPEAAKVELSTAPEAAIGEAASAPEASIEEAASAPEASIEEAASSPETAIEEAASAPEAAIGEAASAPEASIEDAASAPEASIEEAASAPEAAIGDAASAPEAAIGDAASAPETSIGEAASAPEASIEEAASAPEASIEEAASAPEASIEEASTSPEANKDNLLPAPAADKKFTPESAANKDKKHVPASAVDKKGNPPPVAGKKLIPESSANNDKKHVRASVAEKKCNPPPAAGKKPIPESPASNEKKPIPESPASNEKKPIPECPANNEKKHVGASAADTKGNLQSAAGKKAIPECPTNNDKKSVSALTVEKLTSESPAKKYKKYVSTPVSKNNESSSPVSLANQKPVSESLGDKINMTVQESTINKHIPVSAIDKTSISAPGNCYRGENVSDVSETFGVREINEDSHIGQSVIEEFENQTEPIDTSGPDEEFSANFNEMLEKGPSIVIAPDILLNPGMLTYSECSGHDDSEIEINSEYIRDGWDDSDKYFYEYVIEREKEMGQFDPSTFKNECSNQMASCDENKSNGEEIQRDSHMYGKIIDKYNPMTELPKYYDLIEVVDSKYVLQKSLIKCYKNLKVTNFSNSAEGTNITDDPNVSSQDRRSTSHQHNIEIQTTRETGNDNFGEGASGFGESSVIPQESQRNTKTPKELGARPKTYPRDTGK